MSMVGLANINVREEHVRVREEEEGQGRYCAFLTTSVMGFCISNNKPPNEFPDG